MSMFLQDHARSSSGGHYPDIGSGSSPPPPIKTLAAEAAAGGTPLTHSALGAHTSYTNPTGEGLAAASWTSRFQRTFNAAQ